MISSSKQKIKRKHEKEVVQFIIGQDVAADNMDFLLYRGDFSINLSG